MNIRLTVFLKFTDFTTRGTLRHGVSLVDHRTHLGMKAEGVVCEEVRNPEAALRGFVSDGPHSAIVHPLFSGRDSISRI